MIHADEMETSLVWHLRPDLIDPSLFEDQPEVIPVQALRYAPFKEISPLTHTGQPTLASREKGAEAFALAVKTCRQAVDSARALKRRLRPQ